MRFLKATGMYGIVSLVLFCDLALGQQTLNNVSADNVFYPDMIVYNAKLVTVDDDTVGLNTSLGTITEAMAIRDGKIMAVGTNARILRMAGPRTEKLDVKGHMVMPSIFDTHDHAHGSIANRWAEEHPDLDPAHKTLVKYYRLPAGRSDAERESSVAAAIQNHVQSTPPGTSAIIYVGGYRPMGDPSVRDATTLEEMLNPPAAWLWEGDFPTKERLNALAPKHGIMLYTLPSAVINDAFLEMVRGYYLNVDSSIVMDERGRTKDTVPQYERMLQSDLYFKSRVPELAQALAEGLLLKTAWGVTGYASHLMGERFQDAFNLLEKEGRSTVRMAFWHWQGLAAGFPDTAQFYRRMGDFAGMGGDYFWNLGVGQGAVDDGHPRVCTGMEAPKRLKDMEFCQNAPGSRMYEQVKVGIANYMRVVTTHAIADRGIDYYMDAVEEAMKENPGITLDYIRSLRLGTDHCRLSPSPQQIPRMARLGMFKSCEGNAINSVRWLGAGKYPDFYIRQIAPVRSAIEAGVRVTSENTGNFFKGAEQFITRKNDYGNVVNVSEAVDRNTALKMMTIWSAWVVLRENKFGSLEPGKFADFIVLNNDYLTVPVDQIGKIYPLMTFLGGKLMMLREEFAKELGREPVGPQIDWTKNTSGGGGGV